VAERIKTLVAETGQTMRNVGKHPEKQTGDRFYLDGVAYEILSASKFVHRHQREQELLLKRV